MALSGFRFSLKNPESSGPPNVISHYGGLAISSRFVFVAGAWTID